MPALSFELLDSTGGLSMRQIAAETAVSVMTVQRILARA
jgi:hypothetical protein